ncbi:MAG: hypothetical protein HUK19_00090 [Fibrobacter sp.]|nr:hypothetical protein [Fibrobacter sp.]
MKKFLLLMLATVGTALCQEAPRYLHVSTIPGGTDIYINQLLPNHKDKPQAVSPEFIAVTEENMQDGAVLISLFKPGFADTTIRVTLSAKDTSYFIVSLRPVYDQELQQAQEKVVKKRYNRSFGRYMMIGSAIPFAASAISGIVTWNLINKANDEKAKIENSPLASDADIQNSEDKFKNYRDKADIGKVIFNTGVSLGASLLAVGIILQF